MNALAEITLERRKPPRRVGDDPVPAPPNECNGPTECSKCRHLVTMHVSGLCSRCGDWLTEIPALEVRLGDLVLDGLFWSIVNYVDVMDGGWVRLQLGPVVALLDPAATVWVAGNQRPSAVS